MWDPSALAEEDIDEMVHSAEQPGGTRAIVEMYRARQTDAEQNRPHYADPISCPVLAVGAQAYLGDEVSEQLAQVARDVRGAVIPAFGHNIALENPAALAQHQMWSGGGGSQQNWLEGFNTQTGLFTFTNSRTDDASRRRPRGRGRGRWRSATRPRPASPRPVRDRSPRPCDDRRSCRGGPIEEQLPGVAAVTGHGHAGYRASSQGAARAESRITVSPRAWPGTAGAQAARP
jgi:hypothetical protein